MKYGRILMTGAAGGIGRAIRAKIGHLADTIRLSDIVDIADPGANEEAVTCDLADFAAVRDLVEGCQGIIHLGGISVERPFSEIVQGNLIGVYNLYEAARQAGTRRIFFASSNHAIGFHDREDQLDAKSLTKPDGIYGVSKVYGEAIASMYFDKFGIETARVRIGSCFPKPTDHRQLATWLSYDDLVRLLECMFRVTRLGCPVIYGASNNAEQWWDNSHVGYLGWQPQDSAEDFRAEVDAAVENPAFDAPDVLYHGGGFTAQEKHFPPQG